MRRFARGADRRSWKALRERHSLSHDAKLALGKFIDSGWSGETQADAAAKTSKSGGAHSGAASVAPGV